MDYYIYCDSQKRVRIYDTLLFMCMIYVSRMSMSSDGLIHATIATEHATRAIFACYMVSN